MKKRKHLGLIITGSILLTIALFMLLVNVIPPAKVMDDNPFIAKDGHLMIAAHRGGGENNPENTMKAYHACVDEYQVEILESDLWLTKDDKLVYNHDGSLDRISDVVPNITQEQAIKNSENEATAHYIKNYTLEELRGFNLGYFFTDEQGNRPYQKYSEGEYATNLALKKQTLKEQGLQIVELSELFEEFYDEHQDLKFIIEIKDGGDKGFKAANLLDDCLTNHYPAYKKNIVIGTFHDEVEKDLKVNHSEILRGASTGVATKFIVTELLKMNLLDTDNFACLQIPMSYDVGFELRLDEKRFVDQAHKRNIAVQYWTINEEKDMNKIISLGADCIMTDNPKLLRHVLDTKNK